ncbi:hypothetical protein QFW77_02215 [Luteimonas sp. RD2P54]|uniref:Uncharacterized protein n=1 Tax=Luteimonas endophytica TaxID=3042023 RepID=A0ABT6J5K0_9GAMM|nr:hypothetical protein [Luteimonas endophytica]MDH5821812.1 hypothetical protein [Luteimonas endophytica]
MMPWYAWAYLALLALIGLGNFAAGLRGGRRVVVAVLQLVAIAVIGLGVVLFYRGSGAGLGFMAALFVAVLVQARKSVADAVQLREQGLPPAARLGVALGGLALLPGIALGALAAWAQQGG